MDKAAYVLRGYIPGSRRVTTTKGGMAEFDDLLTRDEWSGAPLRAVLENELGPYRGGDATFVVDGPEVDLPPRHVLSLGMTLHELATNAAKHGALSVPGGEVRIAWSVIADAGKGLRLLLEWRETGGPPTAPPTRRGFGTRLIAVSVERELNGEIDLDFAEAGLRVALDVPLTALGAAHLSPLATTH